MGRFYLYIGILVLLPLVGALGFMVIGDWSFLDGLYQSIITLSTIGFGVVNPLTDEIKLFMIFYVFIGIPLFLFTIVEFGEMIVFFSELEDFPNEKPTF